MGRRPRQIDRVCIRKTRWQDHAAMPIADDDYGAIGQDWRNIQAHHVSDVILNAKRLQVQIFTAPPENSNNLLVHDQ